MRKSDYNQLVATLMLMPLTDTHLNNDDFLSDFILAYKHIVEGSKYCGEPTHKQAKKNLEASKRKILSHLGTDPRWTHLDDIQMLLDSFYPAYKLINYYEENSFTLGKFYLQHILDIAQAFITFRDGVVASRSWSDRLWSDKEEQLLNGYDGLQKIELWNNISRTVPMDIFIAAAYVNFEVDEADFLINVPNLISLADVPLNKILKKGVAETHLHLNVGYSYSFLWRNFVGLFYTDKKDNDLWFCVFFRIFSAIYIEEYPDEMYSDFQSFLIKSENDFCKEIRFGFYNKFIINTATLSPTEEMILNCRKSLREKYGTEDCKSDDILFDTIYHKYSENGTSSEIIWYFKMLWFLKKHYDAELCREFFIYIRLKNNCFKNIIQQNKIRGLDYFRNFYHTAASSLYYYRQDGKNAQHEAYYSIFEEQCRTGNLEVLEVKITPHIISSSKTNTTDIDEMKRKSLIQIKNIIGAYKDYIQDTVKRSKNADNLRFPKLGIIYHFIKQNDCDNFSGYNCVLCENIKDLDCMDYATMRKLNIRFCEAFQQLIRECPLLSKYVVGIDAASTENSAEPWVFAPIFRAFRPSDYIFPVSLETRERITNIGFTYHVGEDFRHIASGLRHIDEVLSHFNYCSGDRLGHAIALGVDIDKLMEHNRMAVLPIMEHMENLLWMWSKSVHSTSFKAPQNLEYMIMSAARSIYHNIEGISVYTLWQVYNDKFDIMKAERVKQIQNTDECLLNRGEHRNGPWNMDELLCSHYCPCYFERYNKPIMIRISDEEIALYKALQNSLRSKVEEIGIYVETNPSSNTAIGDIEGIYSHPIINLNNIGLDFDGELNSCVMTTINSDDPLVFSTCVENEIAYIYYSLLNAGCKREKVLEWIDKIRKHGINSSFVKYDETYTEMLDDFEKILNYQVNSAV